MVILPAIKINTIMETIKHQSITNFADWLFTEVVPQVVNYKSDLFYDITKITNKLIEAKRENHKEDKKEKFLFFIRKNGTWLVPHDSPYIEILAMQNEKVWEIEFCWDSDYNNKPFAVVKEKRIEQYLSIDMKQLKTTKKILS
jgi:hypothetical protein